MKLDANPRKLLLPLVPLYRLALAARELRMGTRLEPVRRLRFPVVSIGNLSTGGAGKTPLAIALARALQQRGLAVDVLSRGYRRRGQSAARVDPNGSADDFGDEPLLIAQAASVPVYVAARRYEAGLLAESASSKVWSRNCCFVPLRAPARRRISASPALPRCGRSPAQSRELDRSPAPCGQSARAARRFSPCVGPCHFRR